MNSSALQQSINTINKILETATCYSDTFMGGSLGLGFYYFHSYAVTGNEKHQIAAAQLLNEVIDAVNSDSARLGGTSFCNGLVGFCYVLNYLSKQGLIDLDVEQELEALENQLFDSSLHQIKDNQNDYLHGAFGYLHYLSERGPSQRVVKQIDILIEAFYQQLVVTEQGSWSRNKGSEPEDVKHPNFGLAHGQAGFLLILMNAYAASTKKELIQQMVTEGIRFIASHYQKVNIATGNYSAFPFIINHSQMENNSLKRLAWCYGDLNQVLVLYRAGNLFSNSSYRMLADEVGLLATRRKQEENTMVYDAHFCHGAAGLAQFYKTLYHESGNNAYEEAGEFWLSETIRMLPGDIEKQLYLNKECDLLNGLVGIALTLLSYSVSDDIQWQACMLL